MHRSNNVLSHGGRCGGKEHTLLAVERGAAIPMQRQLFDALRTAILSGRLRAGTRLPASRVFAGQLGVARNTVLAAYAQLAAEGYVEARVGAGTRVSRVLPDALLAVKEVAPRGAVHDGAPGPRLSARGELLARTHRPAGPPARSAFQPGLPALDRFPHAEWARQLARVSRRAPAVVLGYDAGGGLPELREALATYLGAARGVRCEASQVIVTGGAQAGLDLAARLLLDPGDTAWIEEPGYLGARGALLAAGARLRAVPVDAEGLDVAAGEREGARARLVYVTPSCQYPSCVTMTLKRRLHLLDYAERSGAWIVEDDYDSEYRYRGRPLHALQGMDSGGRVVYLGTFAKTLFPGLRVAYLVVPTPLVDTFRNALRLTGQDATLPIQAALAGFLDEGRFARHVRRMRVLYAARQRRFVAMSRQRLGSWLEVAPADTGMQLALPLRHPAPAGADIAIARSAQAYGVVVAPLSRYWLSGGVRQGLQLGYAGVPERRVAPALDLLARALGECLPARAPRGAVDPAVPAVAEPPQGER